MPITPEQCRAARILARIDLDVLAAEAGLARDAVKAFEAGLPVTEEALVARLQAALEKLGVEFLPEEGGSGVGLRLKFDRGLSRQIGRWEAEGGPAGDDDVP